MTWRFYIPCSRCNRGHPVGPGANSIEPVVDPFNAFICPDCGSTMFKPPRVGRFVPTPWWKFWVRKPGTWEYREDTIKQWPWKKKGGDDDSDRAPEIKPAPSEEATPPTEEGDDREQEPVPESNREETVW